MFYFQIISLFFIMTLLEDVIWRDDLKDKVARIKNEFKDIIENKSLSTANLTEEENKLFLSMKRWHKNMHTGDDKWKDHLDTVIRNELLNVKEKMREIPKTLKSFLEMKFKKTNVKEQFVFHEMFDNVLRIIMETFESKLDDYRDEKDEFLFELNDIVCGTPSKDLLFYERVYAPAAVFYIYQINHEDHLIEEDLMEDIFTIGAGAKTYDLKPEITPLCPECEKTLTPDEIELINLNVFLKLKENKFKLNYASHSSKSSESQNQFIDPRCELNDGTCSSENEELVVSMVVAGVSIARLRFNCEQCSKIFSSNEFLDFHKTLFHLEKRNEIFDLEINSAVSLEASFDCQTCDKVFSKEDFLKYHNSIFHVIKSGGSKKTVVPMFVEEGMELMTSFCCETTPEMVEKMQQSYTNTVPIVSSQKKMRTKRRLKYSK